MMSKKNNNTGISLILSKEHAQYSYEIEKCFGNLHLRAQPTHMRLSEGELPMQITIWISEIIAGGIIYDLLKMGIQQIFKKFPNARIAVRKNGILFPLNEKLETAALVVPEREEEFKSIKTIDDVFQLKHESEIRKGSTKDGRKEVTLGEVCVLNYGKSLNTENRTAGGIPVYGSSGITGWHNEALVNEKGLIIGRKGSVGTIYKSEIPFFPIDTVYYITQNDTQCDFDFLYRLLQSLGLDKKNSDSAVPGLNRENAYSTGILLPPLPEQKAIAAILSSFDDKIELLKEQNKTLEEMGQVIFHEWFGKYAVEDELPEGWRVGKLGDIITHIKNNIIPSSEPEKMFLHYSLPSFDSGKKANYEKGNNILSNKYQVVSDSFLVSKLNPLTPRVWTIFQSENDSICSTEFLVLKPKLEKYFALCHCFLNSQRFKDELSQKAHGTSSSHQRVGPHDILGTSLVIPNDDEIVEFQEIVLSHIQKIAVNSSQIQSLSNIRDELLPKLMRGEVSVGF